MDKAKMAKHTKRAKRMTPRHARRNPVLSTNKSFSTDNVDAQQKVKKVYEPTVKFKVTKDRRRGLKVVSPEIKWEQLKEDTLRMQWWNCTNALWEEEKEGKINRADLLPIFYDYVLKNGFTKDDVKNLKKLKEHQLSFPTLSIAYLFSTGAVNPESKKYFDNKVRGLVEIGSKLVEEKKELKQEAAKPTIQEAMREKQHEIMGDIQGLEDDQEDVYKWLVKNNVPATYVDHMIDVYSKRLEEINTLKSASALKKDPQLFEGYMRYKKPELKRILAWYEKTVTDLEAYKLLKQKARKVRVRKSKTPMQLAAKVKYLQYSDEYKLTSIKPEKIVGAKSVFVFNNKTRKLYVYNASDLDKELTIKGTYIAGWDPKTSTGKTLRKPESQLADFMKGGKVSDRKFLSNIRGKDAPVNGKINKDCVLLKAH